MLRLGLGTRNTWLGFRKHQVLALNTSFCYHKHGWKLSQGLLENIQWCIIFTNAEMQTQMLVAGLVTLSLLVPKLSPPLPARNISVYCEHFLQETGLKEWKNELNYEKCGLKIKVISKENFSN